MLNNTVIIKYKLTYHSQITECAASPILPYINAQFGYKMPDSSYHDQGEINGNGLLAHVNIHRISVFTILCMNVNLRKKLELYGCPGLLLREKAGEFSLCVAMGPFGGTL